jgi:hypothetical protein
MPARSPSEMLLSERFPAVYPISVRAHRAERSARRLTQRGRWARVDPGVETPRRVTRHSSPVQRRLGQVDMVLQHNKATNLELAIPTLDGLVLRPGEEVSFWRAIGYPSARRGFLPGLVLVHGRMDRAVDGGLCQLANLLHWMVLHPPLEVTEHHHHGYDPFPDSGRVLPFGSGAHRLLQLRRPSLSQPRPSDVPPAPLARRRAAARRAVGGPAAAAHLPRGGGGAPLRDARFAGLPGEPALSRRGVSPDRRPRGADAPGGQLVPRPLPGRPRADRLGVRPLQNSGRRRSATSSGLTSIIASPCRRSK